MAYSKSDVWKLKVEDLKSALEDLGLNTSGNRKDLILRLHEALFPDGLSQSNVSVNSVQSGAAPLRSAVVESQSSDPSVLSGQAPLQPAGDFGEWDVIKVKEGPVYKRIPKNSRRQACEAFTKILNNVINKNDQKSWEDLCNFARCAIGSSIRGGKKKRVKPQF